VNDSAIGFGGFIEGMLHLYPIDAGDDVQWTADLFSHVLKVHLWCQHCKACVIIDGE